MTRRFVLRSWLAKRIPSRAEEIMRSYAWYSRALDTAYYFLGWWLIGWPFLRIHEQIGQISIASCTTYDEVIACRPSITIGE